MNSVLMAGATIARNLEGPAIAALIANGIQTSFTFGHHILNLSVNAAPEANPDAPALDRRHVGNIIGEVGILAVDAMLVGAGEADFNVMVPGVDGNSTRETISIKVSKA